MCISDAIMIAEQYSATDRLSEKIVYQIGSESNSTMSSASRSIKNVQGLRARVSKNRDLEMIHLQKTR